MQYVLRSFLVTLVPAVSFIFVPSVHACTCMVGGNAEDEFQSSANVVILKARSIEKTEKPPPRLVNYAGIKQTTLTVEKVFKGNLKVGQEIILAQGGGADCVWTFTEQSVGKEYLFYLGDGPRGKALGGAISATVGGTPERSRKAWIASTCSRSGSVTHRANDVKYLENRSKLLGKTRISGRITKDVRTPLEGEEGGYEPLSNFKVKIIGKNNEFELVTDETGSFEKYDPPPGRYRLVPEKIPGFKSDSTDIEIKPKKQTDQNLYFSIDNRVSGKFVDTNGKLLKDVCIKLVPSHGTVSKHFYEGDCTNDKGEFEIDTVPSGRYFLVVNDDGKVSASEPFGTFYYPRAILREDATEITVAPGTYIDDLVITAPTTAETITVKGTIKFSNGKYNPTDAEYTSIEFREEGKSKSSEVERGDIDDKGNFSITILKGRKGKLYGSLMVFSGEYENCPKVEAIVKKAGGRLTEVHTNEIEVDAVSDSEGMSLMFPFPLCKKVDID